jgi:hypothetical protein
VSTRRPPLGAFCAAAVALIAACQPDLDLRPYTIDTRDAEGRPTGAVVAHDYNGTWFPAGETQPGVFTFVPVHEDVSFVVACPAGATGQVEVWFEHEVLPPPESVRTLPRACPEAPAAPTARVQLTVIPAEASLGLVTGETTVGGDGRIAMLAPAWPSDLVAMTADRVLVQRGVSFDPAAPYAVDIARDGVDRVPLGVPLPEGAPGETVTAAYRLRTGGGTAAWSPGGDTEILVAPDGVRRPGDSHTVALSAVRGRSRRWVEIGANDVAPLAEPVAFRPTFEDVDATWSERLALRWTGRPPDDATWMEATIRQDGERTVRWGARFDERWLAIHGQDRDGVWSPPDLSGIRGWDVAWNLDPARRDGTTWTLGSSVLDVRDYRGWFVVSGADWSGSLGQAR